ncbi:MAG: hypothetical protein LBV69_05875 [Bacteroidales bacterium]|jgi:hypothetical protein|nr:hypothetical protein [Bacteroidales bacterium]
MKKFIIIIIIIFFLFECFSQTKLIIENKSKSISSSSILSAYSSRIRPTKLSYIRLKLFFNFEQEKIDTSKFNVIVLNRNNSIVYYREISTGWISSLCSQQHEVVKEIKLLSRGNNKYTLSFPFNYHNINGHRLIFYGLNICKGKYKLYVTYTSKDKSYYSDTIPLYIR